MYIQAHAIFFVSNMLQSTFRKTVEYNTYMIMYLHINSLFRPTFVCAHYTFFCTYFKT